MALTEKDVERLSVLARISLTEEEKKAFARQMSSILDSAAVLDELSTDRIEPLIYVLSKYNVMRDDKVRPSLPMMKLWPMPLLKRMRCSRCRD